MVFRFLQRLMVWTHEISASLPVSLRPTSSRFLSWKSISYFLDYEIDLGMVRFSSGLPARQLIGVLRGYHFSPLPDDQTESTESIERAWKKSGRAPARWPPAVSRVEIWVCLFSGDPLQNGGSPFSVPSKLTNRGLPKRRHPSLWEDVYNWRFSLITTLRSTCGLFLAS